MSLKFQHALERLYGLERRRGEFRVEDTARVLDALDRPHTRFRSVHVGGTNGKGSASALIERVLRAAGLRTGLMTSPHLVDFRERIRVAGRWLDEDELDARLDHIQGLEAARGRTFFEIATVLGFDALARHGVEWGVVEVGLGGRLDATNVLDPEVAVIASVGLDHTEILGHDLATIAGEKAGIVKPGRTVVVGDVAPEAERVIAGVARERSAPLVLAAERITVTNVATDAAGTRFSARVAPWGLLDVGLRLRGRHQVGNAVSALAALSTLAESGVPLPASAVREGLAAARWPGRLEPCPREPRLWWDGAHNADGAERLASAWRDDLRLEPPASVVFAVARDKDAPRMLATLATGFAGARIVVTRTHNERALPVDDLAAIARDHGLDVETGADVVSAVRAALARPGHVLLAGSLFAVGEAMAEFGGAPEEWQ